MNFSKEIQSQVYDTTYARPRLSFSFLFDDSKEKINNTQPLPHVDKKFIYSSMLCEQKKNDLKDDKINPRKTRTKKKYSFIRN